jgi:hypothetical protein
MCVPPQILLTLMTSVLMPDPAALESMTPEQQMAAMGANVLPMVGSMLLSLIVFFVFATVGEGAVCHAAAHRYLGEPMTTGEAISAGFRRLGPLIWTGMVKTILITIGLMFFIIPGVYLAFRYALASQAVVLEGLSGGSALRRSGDLMREGKHIAQIFVIGLIFVVVSMMVGGVVGTFIEGMAFQLIQVFVSSALSSVFAAIIVVFYFSARCRVEGFDLKLLAQQLQAKDDVTDSRY